MANYTREQLRKLLIKLPEDIKEIFMSNETQEAVLKVLEDNDILDERGTKISALIRNVLFGLLPPEDFKESLKKEVGLKDDMAKKISQEINRFVFFPVKESLAQLYQQPAETQTADSATLKTNEPAPENPPAPKKPDTYREPIE